MTNCETRYEKNYIFVICKVNDSMVVNVAVILLKVDSYVLLLYCFIRVYN